MENVLKTILLWVKKRKKYISANDYFYLIFRPNFQSKVIMNIKKVLEKVIESCDIL